MLLLTTKRRSRRLSSFPNAKVPQGSSSGEYIAVTLLRISLWGVRFFLCRSSLVPLSLFRYVCWCLLACLLPSIRATPRAARMSLLFLLTSLSPLYRGVPCWRSYLDSAAPFKVNSAIFWQISLVWHPDSVRGQTIKPSLLSFCNLLDRGSFHFHGLAKEGRSMDGSGPCHPCCASVPCCASTLSVVGPFYPHCFFHPLEILTRMQLKETTVAEVASADQYVPNHLVPVHKLLQHAKVGCV